jgi:hypothetical protein
MPLLAAFLLMTATAYSSHMRIDDLTNLILSSEEDVLREIEFEIKRVKKAIKLRRRQILREREHGLYAELVRGSERALLMRSVAGNRTPARGSKIMLSHFNGLLWDVEYSSEKVAQLTMSSNCPHMLGLAANASGVGTWWLERGFWDPARGKTLGGKIIHMGTMKLGDAEAWCFNSRDCTAFLFESADFNGPWHHDLNVNFVGSDLQFKKEKGSSWIGMFNRKARSCGAISPYETLAVDMNAHPSAIKRAYRQLSLKLHPDKLKSTIDEMAGGNKQEAELQMAMASARYVAIRNAYELLSDPQDR